jgi:hypothetical protein
VLPLLGDRPIASITRADGRLLITTCREKGLRLTTVKAIARTLSTLRSQAVEGEKLPAHPCLRMGRYLRRGDEPKTVIQPLTREEAAHLVATAAAEYPRWHPSILCALRTGMRARELSKVPTRELSTGSGLQVTFEGARPLLLCELHREQGTPGPESRRMRRFAGIVSREPLDRI